MSFTTELCARTKISWVQVLTSVVLLDRLRERMHPNAKGLLIVAFKVLCYLGSRCTHHRLVLTAMVIADKLNKDSAWPNSTWSIACGYLFNPRDICDMERQMLKLLDWRLLVRREDLQRVITMPTRRRPRTQENLIDDYERIRHLDRLSE